MRADKGSVAYRFSRREDAPLLVRLYNDSFRGDYLRYGQCPGYGKTVQQMEESIEQYPKQIILNKGNPVGVLSARELEDGVVCLGCLCVIPEYQGKGIGTLAMEQLERMFPNRKRIELITPADKAENIRFYTQRCGFELVGEEMDGAVRVAKLVKKQSRKSQGEKEL